MSDQDQHPGSLIEGLYQVLQQELATQKALLMTAETVSDLVRKGRFEELTAVIAQQDALLRTASGQRRQRDEILRACGRRLRLERPARIRDLDDMTSAIIGPDFASTVDDLVATVSALQRRSDENRHVMRIHHGLVSDLLTTVTGQDRDRAKSYDQRGRSPTAGRCGGALINISC